MSFSFGTPSSAPATGLSGGFSFGANKPATPGFGLAATSQPSTGLFGSTPATSTPAFGNTSFGGGTFGSAAPTFGTSSAAPTFGTTTPAFGATSTAPTFGATSTAPTFGAGATTTPAFGSTATPAFGNTSATPAFGATSAAPTFGTSATPAFGATTAPSFGTGLGTGGLNFGAGTATTQSTGLFGAPATTTAAGLGGLGGFSFGNTTNTGLGLLGSTATTTTTSSLFGAKLGTTNITGTQPTTSATPSLGLGGLAPSGVIGATTTTDAKSEPPKQQKLPNEISTTIESFKEFVKKQKSLSSDVMRVSVKPLHTVSMSVERALRAASGLSSSLVRGRAASRRQRCAAATALAAADLAASPHPHGSELEGTAPPVYVKELISELEQNLITFRRQMEIADKQMQSSPKILTEQELNQGFRRMHESLVALAGRLQAVHTQVEAQKEQYLNLRKYILKDPTNVFDTPTQTSTLDQILKDVDSGRKKIKTSSVLENNPSSVVLSDPRTALSNVSQLAGPTPFSYIGGGLSPFPLVDTTGPLWQPQTTPSLNTSNVTFGAASTDISTGFQLQKPPGKRGKQ